MQKPMMNKTSKCATETGSGLALARPHLPRLILILERVRVTASLFTEFVFNSCKIKRLQPRSRRPL